MFATGIFECCVTTRKGIQRISSKCIWQDSQSQQSGTDMACKYRERTEEGTGENRKRAYAKAYGKLNKYRLHATYAIIFNGSTHRIYLPRIVFSTLFTEVQGHACNV